jgi:hypothetical protein
MKRLAVRTIVVVVALVSLVAMFGAGSASATRLCKTTGILTICPEVITKSTPMKLVQLGSSKFEIGITVVECSASTLEGETVDEGGAGAAKHVAVTFPKRSFTGCKDSKGNQCTVEPLRKAWNGGFFGSGNVDGTLEFDNDWKFTCGADWCEDEVLVTNDGVVKGGNPAKIEVKLETLTLRAGSTNKCAQRPTWTAIYEVAAPAPMYVTEN